MGGKDGTEAKHRNEQEDVSPLDTTMDMIRDAIFSIKPALVSALTMADKLGSTLKDWAGTNSIADNSESAVLRSLKNTKLKLDIQMFMISEYLNSEYKYASSLSRSHPIQFVGSASLGLGICCAAPIKIAKLPGTGKVFKYSTLIAIPLTAGFAKMVQLKWNK